MVVVMGQQRLAQWAAGRDPRAGQLPKSLADLLAEIQCAKCGHAVERAEVQHEVASYRSRMTVWCHGERQDVVLTEEQVEDGRVTLGRAFETGELGPAVEALQP